MEETMTLSQVAGKLFPLLFNMMGPIGVIPLFAGLTAAMDQPTRTRVARRAVLLGLAALFIAVFMGASMLASSEISKGSLIFAAGLIVTTTALLPLLGAGSGTNVGDAEKRTPEQIAVSPLAFPGLVTPRAIGVLIIFVASFPSFEGKLTVFGVAGLMMVLNLLGMRYAQWFMQNIGMTPLLVLGAVFGVLQVALGVEMMADGWSAWVRQ